MTMTRRQPGGGGRGAGAGGAGRGGGPGRGNAPLVPYVPIFKVMSPTEMPLRIVERP